MVAGRNNGRSPEGGGPPPPSFGDSLSPTDDPLMRELSSMSFSAMPAASTRNVLFDDDSKQTNKVKTKQGSSPSSPSSSPPPSKTCMVLPHSLFGGNNNNNRNNNNKKKKRTLRVSSSAASTADQSSTADPFQMDDDNDQASLLKHRVASTTTNGGETGGKNWYLETMPEVQKEEDQEESHGHMRGATYGDNDIAVVVPMPPPEANEPAATMLLSFPTPRDRSHGARRKESQTMGSMHAYDGEMEPEGVRGQEAKVSSGRKKKKKNAAIPTGSSTSSGSGKVEAVPLRSFDSGRPLLQQIPSPPPLPRRNKQHQFQQMPRNEEPMVSSRALQFDPAMDSRRNGDEYDNRRASMQSNNDDEYQQMLRNNIAEIVRQQHEEDLATRRHEKVEQDQDAVYSPVHAASVQRGTPAMPDDTGAESPSSESPLSNRRSAPVDVDEGSFQDPLAHVQGIHAMAMEHVMRGEYDMALEAFSEVLRVYLKQHGKSHPLTASAYHNLGTVHTKRAGLLLDHTLHQSHCREQALLCFQAAARSARDSPQLGPNHPNVAVSLVRIGFLLLQSRQYQNAVITFEEALRIRLDHYGPTHGLVANLYNNLGVCCMHLQNFPVGRRYLQQALDIQKELLSQEDSSDTALLELADTLCNIGGLNLEWIRQQGPDARHALDAESAFLEALELRAEVLGEQHPLTNQVRSLHDMVRSIPLPKLNGIAATQGAAASSTSTAMNPGFSSHEYAADEISAVTLGTASVPTTPKSSISQSPNTRCILQKYTGTLMPPPTSSTVEGLNLPSLERSMERSISVHDVSSTRMALPVFDALAMSKEDMQAYDVTEESCLLKRPDDDLSSQVGLVVTYAQTKSKASCSTGKETGRTATLNQAKAILDAHRDFMESPQGAPPQVPESSKKGSSNEDNLIPLAGHWPEPTVERISPEVLENPTEHLHTIQNCAANFMKRGRYDEAVHLLEMVVECQKVKNGPVHEDVGASLHNVGIAHLRAEEYYKALQAFEEAVRVRKGALGRDHPQVACSLVKVGISLLLLQRLEDSLWIFREALSVRKSALGSLHPSNARIWNNIGCVHVEFNELKEARRAFESALDIQRNALVNDPENGPIIFGASTTLQNLGYLYAKRDMHEKAAMVLRESLTLQEKVMDPDHPSVLNTLESLGEACLDARRYSHALKYYNELLARYQSQPLDSNGGEVLPSSMSCLKQASILHKISIIHLHQDDPQAQAKKLQMAMRLLRLDTSGGMTEERSALEKKIQGEFRLVQAELGRNSEEKLWV